MSDSAGINRRLDELELTLERLRKTDAGGLPSGATFPTGVAAGFLFLRTDYNFLCVYTGTQWLTVHEYPLVITYSADLTASYSVTTSAVRRGMARNSHAVALIRGEVYTSLAAGTSNATNYWTVDVVAPDIATTVWSFDTKTDTAAANTLHTSTTLTQPASATALFKIDLTKTLAPPNISIFGAVLFYSLVVV